MRSTHSTTISDSIVDRILKRPKSHEQIDIHDDRLSRDLKEYLSEFFPSTPPPLAEIVGVKSNFYNIAKMISEILTYKFRSSPISKDEAEIIELAVRHLSLGLKGNSSPNFSKNLKFSRSSPYLLTNSENDINSFIIKTSTNDLKNNIDLNYPHVNKNHDNIKNEQIDHMKNDNSGQINDNSNNVNINNTSLIDYNSADFVKSNEKLNNNNLSNDHSLSINSMTKEQQQEVLMLEEEINQLYQEKNQLAYQVAATQREKNDSIANEQLRCKILEEKLKSSNFDLKMLQNEQKERETHYFELQNKTEKILEKLKTSKEKNVLNNTKILNLEIENAQLKEEIVCLKDKLNLLLNKSDTIQFQCKQQIHKIQQQNELLNNKLNESLTENNNSLNQNNFSNQKDSYQNNLLQNCSHQNSFTQKNYTSDMENENEKIEKNNLELIEKLKSEKIELANYYLSQIQENNTKFLDKLKEMQDKLNLVKEELQNEKNKPASKPLLVPIADSNKINEIASISDSLALFVYQLFNTDNKIENDKLDFKIMNNAKSKIKNIQSNLFTKIEECRQFLSTFSPQTIPIYKILFPNQIITHKKENNELNIENDNLLASICEDPFIVVIVTIIDAYRKYCEYLDSMFKLMNKDLQIECRKNDELPEIIAGFVHKIMGDIGMIKTFIDENNCFNILSEKSGNFFENLLEFIQIMTNLYFNLEEELHPFLQLNSPLNSDNKYNILNLPNNIKNFIKSILKDLENYEKTQIEIEKNKTKTFSKDEKLQLIHSINEKEERINQLNEKVEILNEKKSDMKSINEDLNARNQDLINKSLYLNKEIDRLNALIIEKNSIHSNQLKKAINIEQDRSSKEIKRLEKNNELQIKMIEEKLHNKSIKLNEAKKRILLLEKAVRNPNHKSSDQSNNQLNNQFIQSGSLQQSSNNEKEIMNSFIDNIGKKLDKCFKRGGIWNIEMIEKAITMIIDKLLAYEKQNLQRNQ